MKNLLWLIAAALFVASTGSSQNRAMISKSLRNYEVVKPVHLNQPEELVNEPNPYVKNAESFYDEYTVGGTMYDNQSNGSIQNRMYLYGDGTIGTTWIMGYAGADPWGDRGTGYNYFDGTSWGSNPTARVENDKTGWPSYAPLGPNGEIVIAHTGASGLNISKREQKGSGTWNQSSLAGPGMHMLWNRSITSGPDHNRVHVLALTLPQTHSGTFYEGLDGALVYSMSTDGAINWDIENQILPGMTSDDYYGFQSDNYTWADPKGDVLAFVVGADWYDMFLMKSTDGGQTFEKTLIWENPYPLFNTFEHNVVTDTFYCVDGAHSLVIDDDNLVHVVFGINRARCDGTNSSWYPFVDGIGYWNENMPAFSNHKNALSPYGDPGSELIEDYNLIGWTQDVDGDGQITLVGYENENIGTYQLGFSSMPQLVINDNDLYLIYASVTEGFFTGTIQFRHLWERHSYDGGVTWGDFTDLTGDLAHSYDECVYPSCAPKTDNNYLYFIYQQDNSPGNFVWFNQHTVGDNNIIMMKVPILPVGVQNSNDLKNCVSQNYPNPFRTDSEVYVTLDKPEKLTLEVTDITGKIVFENHKSDALPGRNTFIINASDLSPGLYFYTVKSENSSVTKKMIVE